MKIFLGLVGALAIALPCFAQQTVALPKIGKRLDVEAIDRKSPDSAARLIGFDLPPRTRLVRQDNLYDFYTLPITTRHPRLCVFDHAHVRYLPENWGLPRLDEAKLTRRYSLLATGATDCGAKRPVAPSFDARNEEDAVKAAELVQRMLAALAAPESGLAVECSPATKCGASPQTTLAAIGPERLTSQSAYSCEDDPRRTCHQLIFLVGYGFLAPVEWWLHLETINGRPVRVKGRYEELLGF